MKDKVKEYLVVYNYPTMTNTYFDNVIIEAASKKGAYEVFEKVYSDEGENIITNIIEL